MSGMIGLDIAFIVFFGFLFYMLWFTDLPRKHYRINKNRFPFSIYAERGENFYIGNLKAVPIVGLVIFIILLIIDIT